MKPRHTWLIIGLLIIFYLLVIRPLVAKPLIGWEVLSWELSMRIFKHEPGAAGLFVHPTFFGYLGALNFKLFGPSEASLRVTGISSFLGTLLLLPVLVRKLLGRENYAFPAAVAVILFALSPLAVQGSLTNDMTDTGLLVFATTVFFVAYYALYSAGAAKKILLLGTVYGFCLCVKVTTSLALPLAVFIFYGFRRKWREAAVLALGIFGVGLFIFSLSWLLNCFLIGRTAEFFTPFKYAVNSFASAAVRSPQGGSGRSLNWLLTAFRMGMWLTPFFVLLALAAVVFQMKQFRPGKILPEENQLLVYSLIVFFAYLLTNAIIQGGFPKYIAPMLPVLCVYIGLTLNRFKGGKSSPWIWTGVFAGGCLYYYYFVGDALYPTYLVRKYSYINQRILPLIVSFAFKELLFPVILAAAVFAAGKYSARKLLLILFVSFCANNAATLVAQSRAMYATGEAYGSTGAEAVKEFCLKNRIIYTCREGTVAADEVEFRVIPARAWQDEASFYNYMNEQRPKFLVYGFACNTIAQMRLMESSTVRVYLSRNYQCAGAGDFVACRRMKE
jgi:4-amino-4-deoxy-L-arabinose transferase-like glycosyltransferase